jgi:hypothetical protein
MTGSRSADNLDVSTTSLHMGLVGFVDGSFAKPQCTLSAPTPSYRSKYLGHDTLPDTECKAIYIHSDRTLGD